MPSGAELARDHIGFREPDTLFDFAKPDTLWVLVDQVSYCPRRQTLSESVWRRPELASLSSFARILKAYHPFQIESYPPI